MYIYSGSMFKRAGRITIALIFDALLFIPVIIIKELDRFTYQMFALVVACAAFITVLSGFSQARTGEIFIAGATYVTGLPSASSTCSLIEKIRYAAILVVFVAGTGSHVSK